MHFKFKNFFLALSILEEGEIYHLEIGKYVVSNPNVFEAIRI